MSSTYFCRSPPTILLKRETFTSLKQRSLSRDVLIDCASGMVPTIPWIVACCFWTSSSSTSCAVNGEMSSDSFTITSKAST